MNLYYPLQLAKPSKAQIDECSARTAAAFSISTGKPSVSQTNITAQSSQPTFIQYNTQTSQRIIQIHAAQHDPLAPSQFKLKNVNQRPPSPPPVSYVDPNLYKGKAIDHELWKIPAAISNWTNKGSHTVALEARVLMDQTGLSTTKISKGHIDFANVLDEVTAKHREGIKYRSQKQQEVHRIKEQQTKQDMLAAGQAIANGGIMPSGTTTLNSGLTLLPTMLGTDVSTLDNDHNISLDALTSAAQRTQKREQIVRDIASMPNSQLVRQNRHQEVPVNAAEMVAPKINSLAEIDDRLQEFANSRQGDANLEITYDTALFDHTRSKTVHITSITGDGAPNRVNPVAFVKTGTAGPNSNSNTNNNNDRERDRNYQH